MMIWDLIETEAMAKVAMGTIPMNDWSGFHGDNDAVMQNKPAGRIQVSAGHTSGRNGSQKVCRNDSELSKAMNFTT